MCPEFLLSRGGTKLVLNRSTSILKEMKESLSIIERYERLDEIEKHRIDIWIEEMSLDDPNKYRKYRLMMTTNPRLAKEVKAQLIGEAAKALRIAI